MRKERLIAAAAAGAILLGAAVAMAQDPVKLAPDRNKVILENESVRVYEVTSPPGKTLEMHSHPSHIVYFIGPGKAKFTDKDGKVTERETKAGQAIWSEPVTHKVENVGTTPLRAVVIELKNEGK